MTAKAGVGALGAALLAVLVFLAISSWSRQPAAAAKPSAQPINFPHPRHVNAPDPKDPTKGGMGMNCQYCHFSVNKSPDPGMPAVNTCMGCHTVVMGQTDQAKTEIKKLSEYWNKKLPVPWVRIHKVPDYVQFPHMRHVSAGVTCQSCHGQVQNMNRVYQASSLNMGWCINCHVNGYKPAEGARLAGVEPTPAEVAAAPKKARYDCAVCHY